MKANNLLERSGRLFLGFFCSLNKLRAFSMFFSIAIMLFLVFSLFVSAVFLTFSWDLCCFC